MAQKSILPERLEGYGITNRHCKDSSIFQVSLTAKQCLEKFSVCPLICSC